MLVHVDVIKEESYTIEIDVPEDKEDELYCELSCEPCMEDIFNVMCFLEEKGIYDEKYCNDMGSSRIETWR